MPFDATLRGQLLSFFGLVVSATIALSSALVFDKAEKAESVERLRDRIAEINSRLKEEQEIVTAAESEQATADATLEIGRLETRRTRIEAVIDWKEAKISST